METALALLERLFRGEPGEVEGRASISLRVVPSPCPLAQLHVDVAERERAKTPQHVCF